MSENSLGEAVEAWEAGGGELCYNRENERWEHQGLSWLQWILSFFGGMDYEAMLIRSGVELVTYGTTINDTIKGKVNALFEKQFGNKLFDKERTISLPTEEQLKEIDKQYTYLYLENGVWKTKELGFISRILRWVGLAYQETRLGVLATIFSHENFEDQKLDQITKLFHKRFGKSFNEEFFMRRQINQLIPKILERDILPQEGERVAEIKEPPLTPVSWKMGNLILSEWTGLPVEFKQDSDEPMAFFIALMEKYYGHFSGKGQMVLQELKQELKKGRAIYHALENV
ncbi:MAG: hypothetical protein KDK71_02050, partial [Chlamydiia bacterium]|nr:hypothetical protein [Chlamydiia bacterium]